MKRKRNSPQQYLSFASTTQAPQYRISSDRDQVVNCSQPRPSNKVTSANLYAKSLSCGTQPAQCFRTPPSTVCKSTSIETGIVQVHRHCRAYAGLPVYLHVSGELFWILHLLAQYSRIDRIIFLACRRFSIPWTTADREPVDHLWKASVN